MKIKGSEAYKYMERATLLDPQYYNVDISFSAKAHEFYVGLEDYLNNDDNAPTF